MATPTQIAGLRFGASAAAVAGVVVFYRQLVAANPTTVALTLLLLVLSVSALWRLRYAIFTALLGAVCFNFFFLPPVGTFTIADPHNWVALGAFGLTAVIGSELAERARRSAEIAQQGRHEAERLYAFSQKLLLAKSTVELLKSIPGYAVEIFGAESAALFIANQEESYRAGEHSRGIELEKLRHAASWGEAMVDANSGVHFTPLRVTGEVFGALGIAGSPMLVTTSEALGSLAAMAIDRVQTFERLSRLETTRERERLRSALIDSVAHEFRTPLTSIKASVTGLLSEVDMDETARRDLLSVIDEEADRLDQLIGKAMEMAQLDAAQVALRMEMRPIRSAVDAAIRNSRNILKDRMVEVEVSSDLPLVRMDTAHITDVLLQLLDNAAKYSPRESPIRITAAVQERDLVVRVSDLGPGIAEAERARIFDEFYRGREQRSGRAGIGMGLAIAKAIVQAHAGTISVETPAGGGSVFCFKLPL